MGMKTTCYRTTQQPNATPRIQRQREGARGTERYSSVDPWLMNQRTTQILDFSKSSGGGSVWPRTVEASSSHTVEDSIGAVAETSPGLTQAELQEG